MPLAYCVNAHSRPSQCLRLVRRLLDDDPGCRVYLHYDQKAGPLDVGDLAGPRLRLIRQRRIYWGSSQMVDLFREMFALALADGCTYAVMLTGQDYPLRNLAGLEDELGTYDVWGCFEPLYAPDGSCYMDEYRRRYSYWWWHADDPSPLLRGLDRVAARLFHVPVSRRELPLPTLVHTRQYGQLWWGIRAAGPGVPLYTGRVWMALSPRAMKAVCTAPRKLVSFAHHVPCAPEVFFQTVLGNTDGLHMAPSDPWYVRHSDDADHPELLTSKDLGPLMGSGAIFGRKFDESVDPQVLDRLDSISHSSHTATPQALQKSR